MPSTFPVGYLADDLVMKDVAAVEKPFVSQDDADSVSFNNRT
jgi:hypothetical protein